MNTITAEQVTTAHGDVLIALQQTEGPFRKNAVTEATETHIAGTLRDGRAFQITWSFEERQEPVKRGGRILEGRFRTETYSTATVTVEGGETVSETARIWYGLIPSVIRKAVEANR